MLAWLILKSYNLPAPASPCDGATASGTAQNSAHTHLGHEPGPYLAPRAPSQRLTPLPNQSSDTSHTRNVLSQCGSRVTGPGASAHIHPGVYAQAGLDGCGHSMPDPSPCSAIAGAHSGWKAVGGRGIFGDAERIGLRARYGIGEQPLLEQAELGRAPQFSFSPCSGGEGAAAVAQLARSVAEPPAAGKTPAAVGSCGATAAAANAAAVVATSADVPAEPENVAHVAGATGPPGAGMLSALQAS